MSVYEAYRENHEVLSKMAREFPRLEAQEIIARGLYGESVDSAIQSVICKEN